mmetsp:Transcript_41442/g.54526  ORF Transcript_41442/g.54526 Transcript_41442/m.54526 type:complete len:82 (-) Transcript_41442:806-1051(-)
MFSLRKKDYLVKPSSFIKNKQASQKQTPDFSIDKSKYLTHGQNEDLKCVRKEVKKTTCLMNRYIQEFPFEESKKSSPEKSS